MITFMIILFALAFLAAALIVISVTGLVVGSGFIVVFGDVIICALVIVFIVKLIFGKNGKA